MDFDALRAAVVPGAAVVGRWPGVICVAECSDRHVLRQLLDVCAGAAGAEPGRTLARRLAGWLGGPDAPGEGLRFGTVAVTGGDGRGGEQWAVFLYGPVGLVVPDRQIALSGAQSVAWTDRLLPRPDAPVVLALEGGPIPPGVVDGVHDLRIGIVPGAGAVLVPGDDGLVADVAGESARNRPDDSRWLDAGGSERPRWGAEPASTAPLEDLYHGDASGNGVPTRGTYGALDALDGGYGGYEAGEPDRATGNGSGRPHLRPVPSGSNGVAHRGWMPRRGSSVDLGRDPEADQRRAAGPAEDEPGEAVAPTRAERTEERRSPPPDRDEPRGPEINSPGIGDDRAPDPGHPRNGVNGTRTNGISYGALGGSTEALRESPRESERSPWSDGRGRDSGRPDRIEGWFATPDDMGTESDLSAVGPTDLRRPRHGRPEDDAAAGATADDGRDPVGADGPADELGAAAGVNGATGGGEYGRSSIGDREENDRDEDDRGDIDRGENSRGGYDRDENNRGGYDRDENNRGDIDRGGYDGGEYGRDADDRDTGEFGTGSGGGARLEPPAGADLPSAHDGEDLDGSGDGTPRLGVPRPVPPPDVPTEPASVHPLAQHPEPEAPHTTMLRSEEILGAPPGEPEGVALEDGPVTGGLVVDPREHEQQVRGYMCGRGHLNDPRVQFCALCGVPMEEQTGPAVLGPRPPLGMIVFDDGATFTVDAEYLMGRMPEADPRVIAGEVRSLALEDTSGAVSRVHAQIIVHEWDALLVDAGSRNGTFVSAPGEQGWTQLPAGETYRLVPGTRVRIGGRSFQFELPSGAH